MEIGARREGQKEIEGGERELERERQKEEKVERNAEEGKRWRER